MNYINLYPYSLDLSVPEQKNTTNLERIRSFKEKKNYKDTFLTSGMIANLMDFKSRIRKWKNISQKKKKMFGLL